MYYCKYSYGYGIKSSLAVVKDDGNIENVFIEERLNDAKDYSGYPFYCINALKEKINDGLVFNVQEGDCFKDTLNLLLTNHDIEDFNDVKDYILKGYESYYTSGYNRAALLVINGINDYNDNDSDIVLLHKFKNETEVLRVFDKKYSISKFYRDAMISLGIDADDEEQFINYSVNGIPKDKSYIKFINNQFETLYDTNNSIEYFKDEFNSDNILSKYDFAATIQKNLNDCIIDLVKYIKILTGEDKLCLAGGMFNNLIINNQICNSKIFSKVHCFSSPGNFYKSIGFAYFMYEKHLSHFQIIPLHADCVGKQYNDEFILRFLNSYSISYELVENDKIAHLLYKNRIMWIDGAANIGRSTSYNRCILSNPFNGSNKNSNVKVNDNFVNCVIPNDLFNYVFNDNTLDLCNFGLRLLKNNIDNCRRDYFEFNNHGFVRPIVIYHDSSPHLYDIISKLNSEYDIPYVIFEPIQNKVAYKLEKLTSCIKEFQNLDIDYLVINSKYLINKKDIILIDFNKNIE